MTGNEDRIEELDTMGRPVVAPTVGRGARLRAPGLSLSSAAVGVLLVATLALGAGALRPVGDPPAVPGGTAPSGEASDAGRGADTGVVAAKLGGDADRDSGTAPDESTAAGEDESVSPSDKPEPTDTPIAKVTLEATVGDGRVRLEWTGCEAGDIAWWKVIRSGDEAVTWPLGAKDTLVAALGPDARVARDGDAPEGRKSWYRVVAVADEAGALVTRCASNLVRVHVPGPEPTAKPTPEPTEKPTPNPEPATLELAVRIKDGHPFLDWSQCKSDAFDYYKVVVSRDERVTWPLGDGDRLAAAISERDMTAVWDKEAPAGSKLYYRVFCVQKAETGYRILAASPVRAVTTPATDPGPAPDPVSLGFEVSVEGGVVHLDWESCASDAFVYYKVVRSHGENPSYLPWTDGTELIGVIENPGASAFDDGDVASGETWSYRVQAIGRWNGGKVLLGETRAIRVEIP